MRPTKGTKTGNVWEAADRITAKQGRTATRSEVINHMTEMGGNAATASTQYHIWKKAKRSADGGTLPPVQLKTSHMLKSDQSQGDEPEASTNPQKATNASHWSELLKRGFSYIGDWELDENGKLKLENRLPDEPGVYGFVLDAEVVYIGITTRTLQKRMDDYRRGHSGQKTSNRIHNLLINLIAQCVTVRVIAASPGSVEWNGFEIDVAPGLETSLITALRPAWNKVGK